MKIKNYKKLLLALIMAAMFMGCQDKELQNINNTETTEQVFSDYKEAFYHIAQQSSLEGSDDLGYNLIYFDDDAIPELVTGLDDYYISLYTYKDGTLYMPIDHWPYGVSGNVGYEYVPYQNSLRNYNTEYAGAIHYTTYSTMNDQFLIDTVAEIKHMNFDDVNENGIFDPEDEVSLGYYGVTYLNGEEVSYTECEKYEIGEYEFIRPVMTLNELLDVLKNL